MRLIVPYLKEALFKGANGPSWRGRIQAIGDGRECVPIVFGYNRYFIEFEKSAWLMGNRSFEESLPKDLDGDYFLPKMDHRIISVWTGVDCEMDGVKQLCERDTADVLISTPEFSSMLIQAVLDYFFSYPTVNQYFFESGPQFRQLIQQATTLIVDHHVSVSWLDEVAPPHHGFSVTKNGVF